LTAADPPGAADGGGRRAGDAAHAAAAAGARRRRDPGQRQPDAHAAAEARRRAGAQPRDAALRDGEVVVAGAAAGVLRAAERERVQPGGDGRRGRGGDGPQHAADHAQVVAGVQGLHQVPGEDGHVRGGHVHRRPCARSLAGRRHDVSSTVMDA